MIFYWGEELLREGLKHYFAKYAYKNTSLQDFIEQMSLAAKKLDLESKRGVTFQAWSDTWLKTAGCGEIELKVETDASRVITRATIV